MITNILPCRLFNVTSSGLIISRSSSLFATVAAGISRRISTFMRRSSAALIFLPEGPLNKGVLPSADSNLFNKKSHKK